MAKGKLLCYADPKTCMPLLGALIKGESALWELTRSVVIAQVCFKVAMPNMLVEVKEQNQKTNINPLYIKHYAQYVQ